MVLKYHQNNGTNPFAAFVAFVSSQDGRWRISYYWFRSSCPYGILGALKN